MWNRYKSNKYGNRRTWVDGMQFDSQHEAQRYQELAFLQKAGKISDLMRQVHFELIPAIKDDKTGKTIQRPIEYVADFTYRQGDETIVEDAKGVRTDVYKLKKKLMRWQYGVNIQEV